MNIWDIDFDVEKYMWCVFKETKDMDLLNFSELFLNESILHETLPKDIIFRKRDNDNNNPLADIMMSSGTASGIVSEKAKIILESEYKELFRFFSVSLEEFSKEKYYILSPTEFLFAEDVLDMKKTDIDYVRNDDEMCVIYKIRHYAFTEKIKGHHFFRMIFNNGKNKISNWRYCDDEFKDFIEKNNITGLEFTKIFEFKD